MSRLEKKRYFEKDGKQHFKSVKELSPRNCNSVGG